MTVQWRDLILKEDVVLPALVRCIRSRAEVLKAYVAERKEAPPLECNFRYERDAAALTLSASLFLIWEINKQHIQQIAFAN